MRIATVKLLSPVDGSSATCDSYNSTMLLTLTTTHNPATDLGHLLHKNPAKLHSFELSFGKAHVFYPEATTERCTAALLLDVDPVGLVRGKRGQHEGGTLDQYVNDRPYVLSSFLSVAMGRAFGTAMSGRSKGRQELADLPIPLTANLTVVACRAGEGLIRELFEPLGYSVVAQQHPLDEKFPEWNVSFVDTSFGNEVLATASLGAGAAGTGWLISQTPATGSNPLSEVTEDFNGDGIPDLAVIWSSSQYGGPFSVTILFAKGDGTFTTGPTVQPAAVQSYPTMTGGDFNGDGKPDLAILSYNGSTTSYITVLLGNGDGTFAAPLTGQVYNQGSVGGDVILGTLAAADFNGDGKSDLAVVGDYVSSGGVTILLGNGDGTFTAAVY